MKRSNVLLRTMVRLQVLLFLTVLASCKKQEKFPISQTTKDFCVFPAGSWWVYEGGGHRDSIWVVSVESGYQSFRSDVNKLYEVIVINYNGDSLQTVNTYGGGTEALYHSNRQFAFYADIAPGVSGSGITRLPNVDSLGTYKGEIRVFQFDTDTIFNNLLQEYRLKYVGPIRKVYQDGTVMDLVNFSIK